MKRLFAAMLAQLLCLLSIALTPTDARAGAAAEVTAVTLSNGMQILIWPDHDIPNVALYNFVRVGSRNEAPGITGLAHFFEHMMFNGTSTSAQGDFDRILEASGASNNAGTSDDLTIYQDWLPSAALETVFRVEADRLRNLAFEPKVVESERGVVYSERRLRIDDDPAARLGEQVQATAFLAHPYGIPTIGWPSDIESWKLDDLKEFYRRNYAPNNCTLVLVGDLDPQTTLALARKYFESIPAREGPKQVVTKEPEQLGERRLTLAADAQTPLLQVAYHGIAGTDSRLPALELLLRILADSDASRLHRSLVEEQKVAISADGNIHAGFDPGLVWFYLSLPGEGDVALAEKAFDAQIERLQSDGVTAAELTRARNQALADFWRGQATIDGKAEALGRSAVLQGDFHKLFDAPRAYEAVTVAEIKLVANQLLQKKARTVGILVVGDDAQVKP
jgi:zinc protease